MVPNSQVCLSNDALGCAMPVRQTEIQRNMVSSNCFISFVVSDYHSKFIYKSRDFYPGRIKKSRQTP